MPIADILTVSEVAEILKVSKRRVQRLIQTGRLPGSRKGRDYLVSRTDAERFSQIPRVPGKRKSAV